MIIIETIPHDQQRYDTLGDWIPEGDNLRIRVSDTGDERMNLLIAIHELIESELCTQRGIPEPAVVRFDLENPHLDDPGSDPRAPYHREHMFAELIERQLCSEFGILWSEYEAACARARGEACGSS